MELSWLQCLIMGLFSGLTDILPVSSQAHQTLLLTFFGGTGLHPVFRLVIHAATLITMVVVCWGKIGRIRRQLRLARMPRRRRNRIIDLAPIMDAKILQTAAVPIVLGLLLYGLTGRLQRSLSWIAFASLLNGLILYLPCLFPTANKDSRLVTPAESILMGLGAGASALPGISSVGASYSVGILHGVDRKYMVHLSVMMHMMIMQGMIFHDVLDILELGTFTLGGSEWLSCGLAGIAAIIGTAAGLRLLESAAQRSGLVKFSFYSFGVAMLTFILYLMV